MNDSCASRPISWLALERYHLGELSASESRRVEAHLDECPACRQCMQIIREQEVNLPPLPEVKPRGFGLRWAFAGLGLAAAALLALVVATHDWDKTAGIPGSRIAYKGGELAVSLVRERRGAILHEPTTFSPGDRFKILVTCPPGEELSWDVVVFQDGQASFPYAPEGVLTCANRVPLPGAFRLTGQSPAVICLMTGPRAPDRPSSIEELPETCVCLELDPS